MVYQTGPSISTKRTSLLSTPADTWNKPLSGVVYPVVNGRSDLERVGYPYSLKGSSSELLKEFPNQMIVVPFWEILKFVAEDILKRVGVFQIHVVIPLGQTASRGHHHSCGLLETLWSIPNHQITLDGMRLH